MFNDLLNETKGLKYQITVKVLLKKYKPNEEIEFTLVYFNSSTKTIINNRNNILFKKFYTELMLGLIKDLVGLLNRLSHNTQYFKLSTINRKFLHRLASRIKTSKKRINKHKK